jgi:lipopolysaccharide/colanic/teichoic acid biosynthesis glycosyltransferase
MHTLLEQTAVQTECSIPNAMAFPRWKRSLDLALVVLAFPIWSVVMVLITLWIRLVSPGPVFFKQERIGYRGRRFMLYKFRSMHVNVETRSHERYVESLMQGKKPMTKLDGVDSRLIPGGRWLRALGLDELPQILNVLLGDMSVVGPRPCTLVEFRAYRRSHRRRVDAPPGLTGLWQVSGKNRTTFSRMIALDVCYGRRMSLALDLAIVCKTPLTLLTQLNECRKSRRLTRQTSAAAAASLDTPPCSMYATTEPGVERA